ncbi:uncharacterized protein A4U43_C03F30250 [Asparagus officinalis]|uniref:Uncharacterized protein n=1 Tax=Asparagus officinalis TaxID=4686 RepID=A0A5P1FEU5_ASPOF|nr:uncharacterized protein A4U43_C03F30250 [Asparagus officinalis]
MAIELAGESQLDRRLSCSSALPLLLPKTLGASSIAESAASRDQEVESIKDFFKSMVGKGSPQLVQQAQTITDSYTNIQSLYPENGPFAANYKDSLDRRPALGRKRARFSLKPTPSHSLPVIDYSASIDHIDDPEEYFSAFEQLENAEKELKKLRGEGSNDSVQPHECTTIRKRRPGLLGKTASYKHHTSAIVEPAEALVESQEENIDRKIPSSSVSSVGTGASKLFHQRPADEAGTLKAKKMNGEIQDATEKEGSVVETKKNVGYLLGKLLSSFKDFDENEGKIFLQENLQMKSIDTGKITLPDLGSIQLSQSSASKNRTAQCKLQGSQISPSLTKVPLKAISAFQRRVSLKDPLKDIYSTFPSDDAPSSGDCYLQRSIGRKSLSRGDDASSPMVEQGTRLDFDERCSPTVGTNSLMGNNIILQEKLTKHPHPSSEINSNSDSNGVLNGKGNISDGYCGGLQEGNDVQLDTVINDQPNAWVEESAHCDSNVGDGDTCFSGGLEVSVQVEGDNMQENISMTYQSDAVVEVLTSTCVNQATTERLASSPSRNTGGSLSSVTNVETGLSEFHDLSRSKVDAAICETVSDAGISRAGTSPPEANVPTNRNLEKIHSAPGQNHEVNVRGCHIWRLQVSMNNLSKYVSQIWISCQCIMALRLYMLLFFHREDYYADLSWLPTCEKYITSTNLAVFLCLVIFGHFSHYVLTDYSFFDPICRWPWMFGEDQQ